MFKLCKRSSPAEKKIFFCKIKAGEKQRRKQKTEKMKYLKIKKETKKERKTERKQERKKERNTD